MNQLLMPQLPQLSVSSGDLMLGIITFSVGSEINSIECADVVAVDDTALESEETFTITTRASFPLVPPNEDIVVTIDTSDTQGQYAF